MMRAKMRVSAPQGHWCPSACKRAVQPDNREPAERKRRPLSAQPEEQPSAQSSVQYKFLSAPPGQPQVCADNEPVGLRGGSARRNSTAGLHKLRPVLRVCGPPVARMRRKPWLPAHSPYPNGSTPRQSVAVPASSAAIALQLSAPDFERLRSADS